MAYPYTNLYGDISIIVSYNSVDIPLDISAGLPVVDQLADILVRHGITKEATLGLNGQFAFELTRTSGVTPLLYGETFAQQGVHDGDTLTIAAV